MCCVELLQIEQHTIIDRNKSGKKVYDLGFVVVVGLESGEWEDEKIGMKIRLHGFRSYQEKVALFFFFGASHISGIRRFVSFLYIASE